MLPGGVGENRLLGGDPLIGGLFTTGRAKATFATEGDFFGMRTVAITAGLNNHRLKPVGLSYGLKVRIRVKDPFVSAPNAPF